MQQPKPNQIRCEGKQFCFFLILSPTTLILTSKQFSKLQCPPVQTSSSYHQLFAKLPQKPPNLSTHIPSNLPLSILHFCQNVYQKAPLIRISPHPATHVKASLWLLGKQPKTQPLPLPPPLASSPTERPLFIPATLLPIPNSHRLISLQRINALSSTSSPTSLLISPKLSFQALFP